MQNVLKEYSGKAKELFLCFDMHGAGSYVTFPFALRPVRWKKNNSDWNKFYTLYNEYIQEVIDCTIRLWTMMDIIRLT